jgi:hypothetical protein
MTHRIKRGSALAAFGAILLAASGCTSKAQCPAHDPSADACNSGLYAKFDPFDKKSSELRPFPDPVFTSHMPFKSATTSYSPSYPGDFGPLLDTLDGFGTYAPILVSFNDVIDPVALPQTPEDSLLVSSPVFLVDMEAIRAAPDAPFGAVVHPITAWYNGTQAGVPVNTMAIAPYVPLDPKHEYAVVVTDRLMSWTDAAHTAAPKCVGPSEFFNCVKSTSRVDPRLEDMRRGLAPLFPWLERQGFARGDVSLALNFTTQSVEDELLDIHKQVAEALPPTPQMDPTRIFKNVSDPFTGKLNQETKDYFQALFPPDLATKVNFDDYDFESMGTIAYGHYKSVDFRHPEFSLFITDGTDGHVRPQSVNDLEFMVVLPKVDPIHHLGPPYKTVVFQHALTVCKETMVVIANEFARRNIAMVGIDVVAHGSRSKASIETGVPHCTIPALDFLTLDDPLNAREGFRQTVADQYQLVRMVKTWNLDLDGDGASDMKTDRIGYVSQSLGSIIGGTFVATEPDVGAGVLNVGGGGLYSVALSFFGSQGGQAVGPDGFAKLPTALLDLMLIIQNTLDRADPINYARFAARTPLVFNGVAAKPKSILLQEAVGDDTVGNYSTDSLTREMGGALAGPSTFRAVPGVAILPTPLIGNVAGGKATIAQTQFSPAKHSFLLELDHPGAFCRGQIQAAEFINAYLETGVGKVIDAYTAPEAAACPAQ